MFIVLRSCLLYPIIVIQSYIIFRNKYNLVPRRKARWGPSEIQATSGRRYRSFRYGVPALACEPCPKHCTDESLRFFE